MTENKGDIRYVGVKETLAYGIANAGQCFGYNIIAGSYLSLFFTKVFGVPPEAVAAMMLFLGLWDTFNDPLMGTIVDKTRTRYGKLRPYLLIIPIPLGLATILLFAGPQLLGDKVEVTAKIIYMFVTYFFWELFYTLGDVPFWGMSAAISPSPSDRTRVISSARFISGILGGISTPILTVLMDLSNNGTIPLSLSQVFLLMSIISATYGMGLFSLAGFCTKERVVQSVKEPSVLDGFKALLRNKPLLLIVIGNVLSAISGIGGFFQAYYYSEVVEMNSLTIIISLPGTILGFITYLLIPKVKEKFDNRQIIFLNGFVRLICGIAVFLVGVKCFTNLWVVVPLLMVQNLLFSFFNTINMVIPTEMIGDTIDYMEWKTGERNEGVSFSVLTFVGKLTGSISGTIGNLLLPLIGLSFVQISATETMTVKAYDYTDTLIWGMFTLAPAVLGLLPLIPYIWYDLTGEKLRQVREEMAERRTVLSAQVSGGGENE
ncbi:MAG: MFS transporter [Clostridia bacterium]|nr:MFS transporter [Clostridia bacterium]